ncbi:phosphohistidinoprotein-hexose phosphotransferase component of N-regulated PTS system (Npr) [Magnetospirillum sp. LM-5]|uniref:HPr family phosphocarrier protein n=1 Tax=Magnetospirillum sp. LM-5 TaxID=2681466 RepID=UPI00137DE389|nr:HPr family phosphocarrier protein [Magnetospirillum sp. LM-5]MBF0326835.1 HPr family phosphocarrier protein [Alphaproteobacteria bacterium]CAA7625435.1 phosphohistidinoprotein-hexose phosphotransferase component of N-regulated PTS system (Npr) [Magnetospirillum sp. LM-5]
MSAADTEVRRTATICNRRGLHARAAAKFVKLVATFDAQVHVAHRGTEVSGMSIMGLMMLAAAPGCSIEMRASGPDAGPALDAICTLIDQKFDEED